MREKHSLFVSFAFLASLSMLALVPIGLHAQTASTGLVQGQVTDPSGAFVPRARVILTQTSTNNTLGTTTDFAGHYVFPSVPPGDYTLSVSKTGFRTAVVTGLEVEVLKSLNANAQLQIGQTAQTVQVTAAVGAELQTTTATIGAVLNTSALENLPQLSRSATALMYLQPGVTPNPNNGSVNRGGNLSGSRTEQITYNVDGGDATSDLEGSDSYVGPPGEGATAAVIPIPIETTQEFRVATSSSNATFDRSSGGQVGILTKRGTNSYHGEVYEYHTDDGLGANSWQNNRLKIHKAHFVDNRFGANGGGPLPFLKNRAWFFFAYEGHRFYDNTSLTRLVPTDSYRQGIIRFKDKAENLDKWSLAKGAVSSNCGTTGTSRCDPLNIGMSPVISSEFARYPEGNNTSLGDGFNTIGYTFNLATPVIEDIAVSRLDFKLNSKWTAYTTYHWARTARVGTEQVDIIGNPASVSSDPFQPGFVTLSVSGQLAPSLTVVTHGSFLRNDWQWARTFPAPFSSNVEQPIQLAGEGIGNNNGTGKLLADPININAQQARGRVWDGHDWYYAQDWSWVNGRHLFQFGAEGFVYHDFHLRTDDVFGGLTNGPMEYVESTGNGSIGGVFVQVGSNFQPPACVGSVSTNCLPTSQTLRYNELYAVALGLVDRATQVEGRNGQFQPAPLGTPIFDNSTIPAYYLYLQDVLQAKPSVTVTYGLAWGVQLPPAEAQGKQTVLVNALSGNPINDAAYLASRQTALSQGVSVANGQLVGGYNPEFGLTPVNLLPPPLRGQFFFAAWHDFSPRISVAWNVPFKNAFFGRNKNTVIRAGYSIMYDRTTAVNQVLSPLLTGGLADIDSCGGPIPNGSGGVTCTDAATTPVTAFRIGVNGNTVPVPPPTSEPVPFVPSNKFGILSSGPFDPYSSPAHAHNVSLSIQRALPGKLLLEVGYIGKFSRGLPQGIALNAPYYLTKDAKSGQTYAQAFDGVAQALRNGTSVPDEPFFDNLIGLSACTAKGFANCSLMVAKKDPTDLRNGDLNSFAIDEFDFSSPTAAALDNTQVKQYTGITGQGPTGGFSNYNAGFISLQKAFSNGLQFQGSWTWSHAIGNQGLQQQNVYASNSPYNLGLDYSSELFDRRHSINAEWTYALPFGTGARFNLHNSVLNRVFGGWNVGGIWTLATGFPTCIGANGNYGSFSSGGTCAIAPSSFNLGSLGGSDKAGVPGSNGHGTSASGINLFRDPNAVYEAVRRPLLSQDGQIPFDSLRTPLEWNVDLSVVKNVAVTERYKFVITGDFLNAFNHVDFEFPSLSLNSPTTFGVFSAQSNTPREIQIGARIEF